MLARSSNYPDMIRFPHEVYVRVEVWSGAGELLVENLPFVSGSVSATLTSRVARRLSLTLDEEFYPFEAGDLMAPYGNEVRAYRGVVYGDGLEEYFPVFRGRIHDADLNDEGQVSIGALDRAADVIGAGFASPYEAAPGATAETFRTIVLDALPDAGFSGLDDFWERNPRLAWEADRGQALDDLADSVGAFWFPRADGTFTLLRVPWTLDLPALFTLADGEGGTVERSQASRTRESVYNSITVFAERPDGSEPAVYTARDEVVSSPTYVYGGFGLRSRQVAMQGASNLIQARAAAETLLRRSKALRETWTLEVTPDASIELGDTFTLAARGRTATQVVAGLTLPLTAGGSMVLDCRAQIPEVQVG